MFKNNSIKMQVLTILSKYEWKPKEKISWEKPKTVMKGSSKEVIPNKKGEKLIKTNKDEIVQ